MDPAGWSFEELPSYYDIRLSRFDANFVDAIHTDGTPNRISVANAYYGTSVSFGHHDFFPNGGNHQPECGSLVTLGAESPASACSHSRAIDLMTWSILNPGLFVTTREIGIQTQPRQNLLDADFTESPPLEMGFYATPQYRPGGDPEIPRANRLITTAGRRPYVALVRNNGES